MYESIEELEAFFKALFDFQMIRKLGEGAFGLAVLAFHETEGVHKVFKLPKDERTTEALKVEGSNLVKLRNLLHPNIIQLHDYRKVEVEWHGRREVRYYLCLAYGGKSLRHKLGNLRIDYDKDGNACARGSGKRLSVEEALRTSLDVCQGLAAAHGFKDSHVHIVHRDIKPENILVDEESGVARIADFGISRVVDRSSGICSAAGTLIYMDPECFHGQAGVYSDIYSLGIVMYEMLTGELPFYNFPARLLKAADDPRKLNPDIPESLAGVILKALEKNLENRYAKVSEMLDDLKKISAELNPLPSPYVKVEQLGSGRFLCDDTEGNERVVVHLIESDVALSEMTREAALLEDLNETSIVVPLRHFRNEHFVGIVTRPVKGRPLSKVFAKTPIEGADNFRKLCEIMAAVCDIVAAANTAGIVHGFLSPDLISCDTQGKVTIEGFGTEPVLRARPPGFPGPKGCMLAFRDCLPFMSETILDNSSAPTVDDDIFSLGAIMYTFLVGHPQLGEDGLRCVLEGKTIVWPSPDPREARPSLPRRLSSIVAQAVQRVPIDRRQNAIEIAAALRECRWPEDIVETLIAQSMQDYQKGDVLRAYELLDEALAADPGNGAVHHTKGKIYYHEHEYFWAVKELEAAVNVEPSGESFVLLGRCFMEWKGQHDRAAEMFQRALQFGDSAENRFLLAKALKAQGKREEALEQLDRAIALEQDPSIRERRQQQLKGWRENVTDDLEATERDCL